MYVAINKCDIIYYRGWLIYVNDKTKYKNLSLSKRFKLIVAGVIAFLVLIISFFIYMTVVELKAGNNIGILMLIDLVSIILVGIVPGIYYGYGSTKAKRTIIDDDKKLANENQYVYLRELPNNFGIGVTTLLMDSTIENYKDIVAVILDLCAKKYLYYKSS